MYCIHPGFGVAMSIHKDTTETLYFAKGECISGMCTSVYRILGNVAPCDDEGLLTEDVCVIITYTKTRE